VSWLVRPGHRDIRRAVVSLIAGISLLDALLIAGAGDSARAVWAVVGFALTLVFQRWVPGT
jgi:4-hydroxybenzoate polyprenyltransferase